MLAAAGDLIPRGLRDPQTGKPSAPKILLVMETGSMLGLHPMAALQAIDVVEGRATLSGKLQKTLITKAGHKVEILKSGSIPGGDYSVTVNATRADNGDFHTSTWDIPRGIRAGSVQSYRPNAQGVWEVRARSKNGAVLPWEAYAENLPVWRAIADIGREGFGDVLFGLYSTEEVRDSFPVNEVAERTEPSREWAALIKAAKTKDDLESIKESLRTTGEGTDELRTAWLTKSGEISRAADEAAGIEDAEIVIDTTPEAPVAGEPEPEAETPESAPEREMTAEEFEAYSNSVAYSDEV
ncbi:hypothetical protein BH09ACT9_BH09ACT9_00180 [soil metagenome]